MGKKAILIVLLILLCTIFAGSLLATQRYAIRMTCVNMVLLEDNLSMEECIETLSNEGFVSGVSKPEESEPIEEEYEKCSQEEVQEWLDQYPLLNCRVFRIYYENFGEYTGESIMLEDTMPLFCNKSVSFEEYEKAACEKKRRHLYGPDCYVEVEEELSLRRFPNNYLANLKDSVNFYNTHDCVYENLCYGDECTFVLSPTLSNVDTPHNQFYYYTKEGVAGDFDYSILTRLKSSDEEILSKQFYKPKSEKDTDEKPDEKSEENESEEKPDEEKGRWCSWFRSCPDGESCADKNFFGIGHCKKMSDAYCLKDSDCEETGGLCDDTINECVEPQCRNHIDNGDKSKKIDITLIGSGYDSEKEFRDAVEKVVDYNGKSGYNGLFSVEPFKMLREAFNVWMFRNQEEFELNKRGDNYYFDRNQVRNTAEDICGKEQDKLIVLVRNTKEIKDRRTRSYAYVNSLYAFALIGEIDKKRDGRVVTHEFGHSFGGLSDEYVEPAKGDRPGKPNCAPTIEHSEEWWGDLAQNHAHISTSEYEGCSYTEENIRPTDNSIMNKHWVLEDDFHEVNERHITAKIKEGIDTKNEK